MFFTRIPIPFKLPWSEEIMNYAQRYYAYTGLIVGGVYALVYWLGFMLFDVSVAVVLSMISGVLLTGAFHEDGFADVCDGFGGGYGKDRILEIMKDSRIGAYGTIGIVLLLLLKYTRIHQLANLSETATVCFLLIFMNAASRFIASVTIYTHSYVRGNTSKAKPIADKPLSFGSLIFAGTAMCIPFIFYPEWKYLLILPVIFCVQFFMVSYFKKHIGGYTGDCLGAIQQVTEVTGYLTGIIIWNYI